jgi:ATP sulfurylase
MNNKKIICTVGPASVKENIIKKMDESGVDLFRINLSHTDVEDFIPLVEKLRRWTNKPICPDTEGGQLRTSLLSNSKTVYEHEIIEFVNQSDLQDDGQIGILGEDIRYLFKKGDLVTIDFDGAVVQIIENLTTRLRARVLHSGKIGNNKGISLDRVINLESFTTKDYEILEIAGTMAMKYFFLSFCSHPDDVTALREKFDYPVHVISKIESKKGLYNLSGICEESDAILIDRGDLSRDVPLEKIPFAQQHILEKGKALNTPVYVATNLMENMIINSKPTRAEVNDIRSTINDGASGLVLAAETAIGNYPVECVRILARIIEETKNYQDDKNLEKLFSLPSGRMIEPHGGKLVQQFSDQSLDEKMESIIVDEQVFMDAYQIANGTFSPVSGFMNLEEINSILSENMIGGITWTLPILFQVDKELMRSIPKKGAIYLKKKGDDQPFAILKIQEIENLEHKTRIARLWFGTEDNLHPGVAKFMAGGDHIISGQPYLLNESNHAGKNKYELTPSQTRYIFDHNGWHNIIGFHTRNVPHKGHEFIQKKALQDTNADAIFISPVTGIKKSGDFLANPIIECYNSLIRDGIYEPYGALIGAFNTHSRYSGPREAVFTALCRQNYGCNYFIVGRDHTGVGDYYEPDASLKYFDTLELDIKILSFNSVSFLKGKGLMEDATQSDSENKVEKISGSVIREQIMNNGDIPDYLMRSSIVKILKDWKNKDIKTLFHP